MSDEPELTPLVEIADVLARHGSLLCAPCVALDDGQVILTLTLAPVRQPDAAGAADTVELLYQLRYVVGVCQIRAFASRYGIDPTALEALLPHLQEDQNG